MAASETVIRCWSTTANSAINTAASAGSTPIPTTCGKSPSPRWTRRRAPDNSGGTATRRARRRWRSTTPQHGRHPIGTKQHQRFVTQETHIRQGQRAAGEDHRKGSVDDERPPHRTHRVHGQPPAQVISVPSVRRGTLANHDHHGLQ
ncbi:hypothetical protein [Fodinicola feengrottensis]|uniref:hypothetical protein n=1 Tax=Fodinicola feengrottensis TaxID=435914 RepID=UPI0013D0B4A1|nr:hypothetical protein [Fodinicola feengrottensis]